jgi:hypothetical protein
MTLACTQPQSLVKPSYASAHPPPPLSVAVQVHVLVPDPMVQFDVANAVDEGPNATIDIAVNPINAFLREIISASPTNE